MNKTFLHTLLYAASFVLLCTGIIGTAIKRGGKNLKAVQTALLNPKYVQDINTIRLRQNAHELTLFKDGGFWFVRIEGHALRNTPDVVSVFPADSRQVDTLIDIFRKVRKMYIISDRGGSEAFFMHNEAVFTLNFVHTDANKGEQGGERSDERVFSSLRIAVPKNGTKTLHIASESKAGTKRTRVYACEDDVSVFLNYNPSFWADGKLIPDCLRGGKGEKDVQKLILREYRNNAARVHARDAPQRTLVAGDGVFESAVHTLFEARTAQITTMQIDTVQAGGASAAAGETPVSSFSAVFADGSEASFSVYKRGTDYSAVPENPYTAARYALSISELTYESLIDPFRR
jgi:hypothetical protein